ncbi:MAG: hypothetical protein GX748_02230 [Lentisphaerae bacterium]|nr:hypothetical protein [Lentisphaerota bacterium]
MAYTLSAGFFNPGEAYRISVTPVERSAGGRFVPSSGQGTLRLPEHAFKPLVPGARARVVLDLDAEQPDGEWCAWRVALRARTGGPNLAEVQTVPGAPGVLRYEASGSALKLANTPCRSPPSCRSRSLGHSH